MFLETARLFIRDLKSEELNEFIESPSYGDGGMAAAVRIVSAYYKMESVK